MTETAEEVAASSLNVREMAREQIPHVVATPDPDEPEAHYERSPAAALRLVICSVGLVVAGSLGELLPRAVAGLEQDLQVQAGSWARGLGTLSGAVAAGTSLLLAVLVLGAAIMARRPRQLLTALLAGALAASVVLIFERFVGMTPNSISGTEYQLSLVAAALAMSAAAFTVFTAPIIRWATGTIVTFTLIGVLGAQVSLVSRVMVVLFGEAAGALVAVVFGTTSRRVGRAELLDGLQRTRLPVEDLERHDADARGSQPWTATLSTGTEVFVKVEAIDELRAAQLYRLWRRIRLKDAVDTEAPSSSRRSAEHEAFVSQRAQTAGVRTPTVLAIGVIDEHGGVFTVFEKVEAVTLADLDELGDVALRSAWSQIQVLRRAGIAHRDLRAANLMCHDDDIWVIDFGAAEVAANDEMLNRDLAEFVASTAALVGVSRAVDAAVAVMGPDTMAEAIPWLQPLAVTVATRTALAEDDFEELREQVRQAAGLSAPELPQLQRVTWKGVAVTVALGIAVWTLLPQLTSGIDWGEALRADKAWIAAALVASAVTYVGAAISVSGSVTGSVSLVTTFFAQLASSFTNRVAPGKVGGIALNLRYLTKQGVDSAVAATGLAVSTAAGTVVHVTVTLIAVFWAGSVGFPSVSAPPMWIVWLLVAVVVCALLAALSIPAVRRWWSDTVVPSLNRAARSFIAVMRSPQHLVMVFGGSALVTIANLAAFAVSLRAFGIAIPLATAAVVYLAGSALASAAPTPGGLGATEAALVAGLAVVGVADNEAIPAVLLFRLATFWVPILPGWISLVVLQRRGDL